MDAKFQIITIYLGCLLLSRESLSQVIFPDGGFTTQPTTAITASNPYSTGNYQGNNNGYSPYGYNQGNNNGYSPYIQTNVCICVNPGRCFSSNGGNPADGSGVIDIRIVNTASGVSTGSVSQVTSTVSSGINPIVVSQSFCQTNLALCCPTSGYSCGIRYSPYSFASQPTGGQAPFGAYPWQAIILTSGNIYVGAGVLIDHMHVLTVAHKVNSFLNNGVQMKVRMGEWDASNTNEPIPSQEFTVTRIFIHPQYSSSSLSNSIAILRLSPNVPLGPVPTITTGCLAGSYVSNMRCWVAGWGASSFTAGSSQSIQTHVDVPLVDQATCQSKLRTTKLGSSFVLDTYSFLCAGGEAGKDACTGDGGSPLVCPIAGKWYVIGLVAWGIGCGTTDVPGVYINVTNYINWIQSTTRS